MNSTRAWLELGPACLSYFYIEYLTEQDLWRKFIDQMHRLDFDKMTAYLKCPWVSISLESLNGVSRSFPGFSRKFQGCFNASREFQGNIKGVPRKYQGF